MPPGKRRKKNWGGEEEIDVSEIDFEAFIQRYFSHSEETIAILKKLLLF